MGGYWILQTGKTNATQIQFFFSFPPSRSNHIFGNHLVTIDAEERRKISRIQSRLRLPVQQFSLPSVSASLRFRRIGKRRKNAKNRRSNQTGSNQKFWCIISPSRVETRDAGLKTSEAETAFSTTSRNSPRFSRNAPRLHPPRIRKRGTSFNNGQTTSEFPLDRGSKLQPTSLDPRSRLSSNPSSLGGKIWNCDRNFSSFSSSPRVIRWSLFGKRREMLPMCYGYKCFSLALLDPEFRLFFSSVSFTQWFRKGPTWSPPARIPSSSSKAKV